MAEAPKNAQSVKFYYVAHHDLDRDEMADPFEKAAPAIAGEMGAGRAGGHLPLDRGGSCEWRLE